MAKNTLEQLYSKHTGKVSDKWSIYITEYERIFKEYRDKSVNLLEIGIQNGGSLEIWSKYFENARKLIGCDINPDCAFLHFNDSRIAVVVGDANLDAVQEVVLGHAPTFDLIIDDGSHRSSDVVKSFAQYFPYLADDGVFIVEDLHTSYWQEYEGGLFDPFSSMTFFKRLADIVNYEHWGINKTRADILSGYTVKYGINMDQEALQHIHSVEFINSMCIIRKVQPERNRLGQRIIAGTIEMIEPGRLRLQGSQLNGAPNQSGNVWTARSMPPGEELILRLKELAERNEQIGSLHQSMQVLSEQLAAINISKAWKLALFFRKVRETLFPLGSRRNKLLELIYQFLRVWRNEGLMPLIGKIRNRLVGQGGKIGHLHFDYQSWIFENEPKEQELAEQQKTSKLFLHRPLISILTPVYNTPEHILHATIQSVINQTYDNWELCLVDGNSDDSTKKVLEYFKKLDPRIKCEFLPENLGIASNTNVALNLATGEYINLLDHDDLLPSFTLFEIVKYINRNPNVEILYGDEDHINMLGLRHMPFFKPDWDPELLQCVMYIGHSTYKKELVLSLGGFRPEYDFSQDYDLALRATEVTSHIGHIPKILYHWRELPGSAAAGGKDYARKSNIAALADAVRRRGYKADTIIRPTHNEIRFHVENKPLVSIIIPSDNLININKSLKALLSKTDYQNIEILVVTKSELALSINKHRDKRVRSVIFDQKYNFSAKCNAGVAKAEGEYVLFLNDDVYPLESTWLETMIGPFQQQDVGAVSPMLIYTNGTIQHAGLVTSVRNLVGTAFHTWHQASTHYFNMAQSSRTASALSAACMLMHRGVFNDIGGFDEINTPIMHSDLDLSFKIRDNGLRLVVTPYTRLKHVGHLSIKEIEYAGVNHSPKADAYLLKRWAKYIGQDPYFPDNMRDMLYIDSPTKFRMWAKNPPESINRHPDILIQTHDLSLSGVPIIAHDQAVYLADKGYFVTIVSAKSGELLDTYKSEQIPVIIDPLVLDSPQAMDRLLVNFDVVMANTIMAWSLVLTAKSLNIPVLWVIQEGDYGVQMARDNKNIQNALSLADRVIFSSHQTLIKYSEFSDGHNYSSMFFGVEAPSEILRSSQRDPSKKIQIIHIGSVENRKGQDILIEAIKALPPHLKDKIEVSFIGRILDDDFYQRQLQESAILPNVHWLGSLSHIQVWERLSQSDVLVCSSRDETGPLVVYEAMSLGKAVLSTPVGAVPEIIQNGVNGMVFSRENTDQLSNLIAELCLDKTLVKKLGIEAFATYNKMLTKYHSNEKINDLIMSIIK